MTNKKIIILLIILLVIPMALSVKPTQTSTTTDVGLDIRIPPAEFIKQNEDVISHVHVYNKSSGFPMTNETTSCFLHIYNLTGEQFYQEDYPFDENELEFELDINGNNFSQLGFIGFIIQCNTSNEGGFVSGSLRITETGEDDSENNLLPIVLALIATIIFFSVAGTYAPKDKLGLKIAAYSVAMAEIVNLSFMVWLHESGRSLISMLRINFWILFLIIIGIAFIALIFLFMRALNLDDSMEDDDNKKWRGH